MTLLVVDDEASDIEAMRRTLEGAGFQVLAADSYDTALQVFDERQLEISAALIDISLPGKNGVELAQELLKRNPNVKILFISGHVGAEVIRFYGLRVTDRHFLKKPFSPDVLLSRVQEVLNSLKKIRLHDSAGQPQKTDAPQG